MIPKCSSGQKPAPTSFWAFAAGLMGKSGDEAAAYAIEVVKADFEEAGTEDVVRKVASDLGALSNADAVRGKLVELLPVAKAQLMTEL